MIYLVYILIGIFSLFILWKLLYVRNLPIKVSKFILLYFDQMIPEGYSIDEINEKAVNDYMKISKDHIMKTEIKKIVMKV